MGRQEMGWEGPTQPRPCRLVHLMAMAVSLLICGPGKWHWAGPVEDSWRRGAEVTGALGFPNAHGGALAFWHRLTSQLGRRGCVFWIDLSKFTKLLFHELNIHPDQCGDT